MSKLPRRIIFTAVGGERLVDALDRPGLDLVGERRGRDDRPGAAHHLFGDELAHRLQQLVGEPAGDLVVVGHIDGSGHLEDQGGGIDDLERVVAEHAHADEQLRLRVLDVVDPPAELLPDVLVGSDEEELGLEGVAAGGRVDQDAESDDVALGQAVLAGPERRDDLAGVDEHGLHVGLDDQLRSAADLVVGPLEEDLVLAVIGDSDEFAREQGHGFSWVFRSRGDGSEGGDAGRHGRAGRDVERKRRKPRLVANPISARLKHSVTIALVSTRIADRLTHHAIGRAKSTTPFGVTWITATASERRPVAEPRASIPIVGQGVDVRREYEVKGGGASAPPRRHLERAEAHLAADRSASGRSPRGMLALQRSAGNRAVAQLAVQRLESNDAQGGKASTSAHSGTAKHFELFFNSSPGPYTVQLYTVDGHAFGHAWIGVSAPNGNDLQIGFFPKVAEPASVSAAPLDLGLDPAQEAILKAATIGCPGIVRFDSDNRGKQNHTLTKQTGEEARKLLDVIQEFQAEDYVLYSRNCATFAAAAWERITGTPAGLNWQKGQTVWFPDALSWEIDQRNQHAAP